LDDAEERKETRHEELIGGHNKLATLLLLPPLKWEHVAYRTFQTLKREL